VNIDRKINNTYSPKLSSAKVIYDDIDEKIKKTARKTPQRVANLVIFALVLTEQSEVVQLFCYIWMISA